MRISKEQIEAINKQCPMDWQVNEQGIFSQPYGIPDKIKSPVIYMRWETGGVSGGSCWDSSDPQPYEISETPEFEALDITIKELAPNISYLMYRKIEKLIKDSTITEWEYYGNCTDFGIKYIVLDDLLRLL